MTTLDDSMAALPVGPGSYVLLFEMGGVVDVVVGRGGRRRVVEVGPVAAYCGSAHGGIARRVAAHAARDKVRRFHVDGIIEAAGFRFEVVARPGTARDDECRVARRLARLPGASRPERVGNSDCAANGRRWCLGHVVNLPIEQLGEARRIAGQKGQKGRKGRKGER